MRGWSRGSTTPGGGGGMGPCAPMSTTTSSGHSSKRPMPSAATGLAIPRAIPAGSMSESASGEGTRKPLGLWHATLRRRRTGCSLSESPIASRDRPRGR